MPGAYGLAAIFLVIYVGLRFRKIGGLSAGIMALLALLNDLLVAYFAFVIFRIPLDDNFVAVVPFHSRLLPQRHHRHL